MKARQGEGVRDKKERGALYFKLSGDRASVKSDGETRQGGAGYVFGQ